MPTSVIGGLGAPWRPAILLVFYRHPETSVPVFMSALEDALNSEEELTEKACVLLKIFMQKIHCGRTAKCLTVLGKS